MLENELIDGMRVITLDRPEKANALTPEMLEALLQAVRACTEQVLLLTGAGKVFSAGADLEAARVGLATSPLWEQVSKAIADFDGLSIAALNGTVAGGACGMALACDLRIAVPNAKIFYPVMKLGFLPQPSDVTRLVRLAGPARAKLILMAGAKISADEALAFGLLDRIAPADELLSTATELANDCLAANAGHVRAIKAMIDG